MIRRILLILAPLMLVLLSGCRDEDGPMKPGIYGMSLSDGTNVRMIFTEDGGYSAMQDNIPKPVDEGTWERRDGQLCLNSAPRQEEACLDETAAGDAGNFTLTEDGETTLFTKLSP